MDSIIFSLVSPEEGHLVLSLSVAGEGKKRFLYQEYLSSFSKQKEELDSLMQEELRFRNLSPLSSRAETTPFNRVRIPLARASKVLKLLANSSGLYLSGKRLTYDPVSAPPLQVEAVHVDEKLIISGSVDGHPMTTCDWFILADQAWIVKGGILQKIKGDVDRAYWSLVYPGPSELTGRRKEAFLDRLEEEAPPFVSLGKPPQKEGLTPYPFLKLKDFRGACADLCMDYGGGREIALHDPLTPEWRNLPEEKVWERDLLEAGYSAKIIEDAHYFCSPENVAKTLTFLIEMGWKVKDKEGREVLLFSKSSLNFEKQKEAIIISGSVSFSEQLAEFTSLLQSYQKNEPFLSLSDHSVGLIDRPFIEKRWGALSTQEVIQGQIHLKRLHFGLLASIPEVPGEVCPRPAAFTAIHPGSAFQGKLHPYQQLGLSYLKFLYDAGFHGLLADEMGLGKTVQVLALFSLLEDKGPHLIVMPTSLLFNWRKEFEAFLPKTSVTVHSGPTRARSAQDLRSKEVILTSYALLRQDVELLSSVDYGCIVLDEAQVIKNPRSQGAGAACLLTARFRLALSGTPIVNSYDDLKSLFHFLIPELLGDLSPARLIQQKIAPFVLRRTKSEVVKDLPPKIEQTIYVEMDESQAELYDTILEKSRRGLMKKIADDGAEAHRMEILEVILRLRQICCHPRLVDPSSTAPSAKLQTLLLDLEEMSAEGSKVLVYSQFTSMLRLIEKEVKARNIPSVYLDGSTKDREKVVDTFQNDPNTRIFLCSLKAGGVGLNLQSADYVLLFDPWWNVAIEDQAIGRAHRLGREGTLVAKRYLTPFSVEAKMQEIKKTKTRMSLGQMMPDRQLKQLKTQDLLKLLDRTPPQ